MPLILLHLGILVLMMIHSAAGLQYMLLNTAQFRNLPPPMLAGRNHAGSCTDGAKLYVFGGRSGKNIVGQGFSDTQVHALLSYSHLFEQFRSVVTTCSVLSTASL